MNEIWVVITSNGQILTKSEKNALAAGRLCKQNGTVLTAILPGGQLSAASDLSHFGVDRVMHLSNARNDADAIAYLLHHLTLERTPSVILLTADNLGHETAARLAAQLQAHLTQDCVALEMAPPPCKGFTWVRH